MREHGVCRVPTHGPPAVHRSSIVHTSPSSHGVLLGSNELSAHCASVPLQRSAAGDSAQTRSAREHQRTRIALARAGATLCAVGDQYVVRTRRAVAVTSFLCKGLVTSERESANTGGTNRCRKVRSWADKRCRTTTRRADRRCARRRTAHNTIDHSSGERAHKRAPVPPDRTRPPPHDKRRQTTRRRRSDRTATLLRACVQVSLFAVFAKRRKTRTVAALFAVANRYGRSTGGANVAGAMLATLVDARIDRAHVLIVTFRLCQAIAHVRAAAANAILC